MTKAEARKQLRELPALSEADLAARSREICEQARAHPAWKAARVVALYSASRHEPALDLLWQQDPTRAFAFPRVEGQGIDEERLAFYRVRRPEELLESRWGLREPAPEPDKRITPEEIDYILVPGVAFSKWGTRLGRGRGHYDRFLPRLRPDAVIAGVCFRERLLPELPEEPHDRKVHVVFSA
jgi:5-formyltetrahydrofolate cyclo-ligase